VALKPFLNRHLGGFGDANKENTSLSKDSEQTHSHNAVKDSLGEGEPVFCTIDEVEVVATVVHDEGTSCTIRYFDPLSNILTTRSIPKAKLHKPS